MWDIFSVSSGNTWFSTKHRPSKVAPGKDDYKFELSWMMCNIQKCVETRASKDDGWLEQGAVWMAVVSAAGFMAKISWTFSEQHDKSKHQHRVGPTSTELLLALCCLLTVRSKALCDLESFMTLNLLDAEFRHCSFLVSYLFLIHFHFVYFSSVRWKILLGFLCRNRLLLTGTPIQNSMAEVCLYDITGNLPSSSLKPVVCSVYMKYYLGFFNCCFVCHDTQASFIRTLFWCNVQLCVTVKDLFFRCFHSCGPCCILLCQPFLIHTKNSMSGFQRILKIMQKTNQQSIKVKKTHTPQHFR